MHSLKAWQILCVQKLAHLLGSCRFACAWIAEKQQVSDAGVARLIRVIN
jgi:hypothetical protein